VVLDGVEADLVAVGVMQLGQDPADAGQDGLLDPAIDLIWLIDTSNILAAAETYLLITHITGWDLDAYERWLVRTISQLTASPAPEG
jgi:hypothetical protein